MREQSNRRTDVFALGLRREPYCEAPFGLRAWPCASRRRSVFGNHADTDDYRFARQIAAMRRYLPAAAVARGFVTLVPSATKAVTCAEGVYRAGCAGPNGAAVVRSPE
jgi:hypothetical protein